MGINYEPASVATKKQKLNDLQKKVLRGAMGA